MPEALILEFTGAGEAEYSAVSGRAPDPSRLMSRPGV